MPVIRLTLCAQSLSRVQSDVISSYRRGFALRALFIEQQSTPAAGPCLFTGGSPIVDKQPHCYWNWGDNAGIDEEAGDCGWLWHHGPSRTLPATGPRLILLPRNDLFEIRGIDNTPQGWAEYRERINVPWSDKRDEIYFRGHFTGEHNVATNARALACNLLRRAGLPENCGLLAELTPRELLPYVSIREPDPLYVIGQHKFVLSLWGNHPFNPRLYRGLEGGSLVFHQATPGIRLLEDGLLEPGHHYVEIAPDLADLVEKVEYFIGHPGEAREIANAGHAAWMKNLFASAPYRLSDTLWQCFTSQPNWPAFREAFAVQ
jgi:hypothetical protein